MWNSPPILSSASMPVKVIEALVAPGAKTWVQSLDKRLGLGDVGEASKRMAKRPSRAEPC